MPARNQTQTHKPLSVRIRGREGMVFQGEVKSVSSTNDLGLFDILRGHNNFISLVDEKIILVTTDGTRKEIPIGVGILRVLNNTVDVYLGIW